MKNLQRIIAISLMIVASACHLGGRHTTIVENTNGQTTKIEYAGQTYFTEDGRSIKSISPNGYVKYTRNSRQLIAESDSYGHITYELNDGEKCSMLSENDKDFLAQAVKDMIRLKHNDDKR